MELIEPSVSVRVAEPELLKVTPKGVRIEELEIVAPVNDQETVVVGPKLVVF